MILLTDVAAKLGELLNSYALSDYLFVVKSAGYHLDSIANKKKSRNTIPVFISMIGGEYNPVPNLKQVNTTYEVNIYFPVRFKEDFYNLNTSLVNWFVGKKVTYGTDTALCNISVAEYGEIENLQFHQFENWVMEEYGDNVHLFKNEHEVNEPYMSMKFRLFATTLGTGFIFGNDVKYTLRITFPELVVSKMLVNYHYTVFGEEHDVQLTATRDKTKDEIAGGSTKYYGWTITYIGTGTIYTQIEALSQFDDNTKIYVKENGVFVESTAFTYISMEESQFDDSTTVTLTENLVWDSSGTGASISPISEQLIGNDKYARNIPNITNFNKSIVVYARNNDFWTYFLACYNRQELDVIKSLKLTKEYTFGTAKREYEFSQILLSYNENITLGEPVSFTLAFGD